VKGITWPCLNQAQTQGKGRKTKAGRRKKKANRRKGTGPRIQKELVAKKQKNTPETRVGNGEYLKLPGTI